MPRRLLLRGSAALLALLAATGCAGGTNPSDPTSQTTAPPPTQDAAPTATSDPPSAAPRGPAAALLSAQSLPAPGDVRWRSSRTVRGTGFSDVSVCQRPGVSLRSIGATRGARARFRSGSVTASHVVVRFVDERSATLAHGILEAWLSQCAQHAGARGFESVEAPAGYTDLAGADEAGWALVSYGPVPGDPESAYIQTQALVRAQDTLSWVVWTQIGQDYNYEPGQAPPERAVPLLVDALTDS